MSFVRHMSKHNSDNAKGPSSRYYPPQQFRIADLDFDTIDPTRGDYRLQRLEVEQLIGASAFEAATYTAGHVNTCVYSEMTEGLRVIEEKFHAGQYDAEAMPLVEAFLSELQKMTQIQIERNEINDIRIADIKEANIAAYNAVCDERRCREEAIECARKHEMDSTIAYFEKRRIKAERKAARKQEREKARAEKEEAKSTKESERRSAQILRAQRRRERLSKKQNAKAEAENRKWEQKQARSELDFEKLKSASDAKRAKNQARQAKAEADIEIARAKVAAVKAEGERALRGFEQQDKLDEEMRIDVVEEEEPSAAAVSITETEKGSISEEERTENSVAVCVEGRAEAVDELQGVVENKQDDEDPDSTS